jgi:amino-acid N-acetyltransferase
MMPGRPLPTVVVRRARADNRAAVERLLAAAELPLDGLADHFGGFLVAVTSAGVVGTIGIEYYPPYGLLRSAVVDPGARGRGVGALLTARVLEDARARGVHTVYLLTTTAASFFARVGFRRIPRAEVPAELGASAELRGACPETATVMMLELGTKLA